MSNRDGDGQENAFSSIGSEDPKPSTLVNSKVKISEERHQISREIRDGTRLMVQGSRMRMHAEVCYRTNFLDSECAHFHPFSFPVWVQLHRWGCNGIAEFSKFY